MRRTRKNDMRIDTVIFGGGVAGLWLLDELVRRGTSAVLLEAGALGSGQTVASQGILHGGLKYTLQGMLTGSAIGIRDMPGIWRDCLAGNREPNLSATRVRSDHCYLWRTDSVASKLGMIGAKFGLRVAPQSVAAEERPAVLASCPGTVARLDEPVVATDSLLAAFAERNRGRILKIDAENGLELTTTAAGEVTGIIISDTTTGRSIEFEPRKVVFTAGAGNAQLRERVGLQSPAMQRRPLHMVLVRARSAKSPAAQTSYGAERENTSTLESAAKRHSRSRAFSPLPELNGHCVDGRKTRVTVTSDVDSAGRRIWQVGGQVAEEGVVMSSADLIAHTRNELLDAIPGLDLSGTEWSTYRVDRAEQLMRHNRRPETVSILRDGNTLTAWPTKLVLAPQLAENIADEIAPEPCPGGFDEAEFEGWPAPDVARTPWDAANEWIDITAATGEVESAA